MKTLKEVSDIVGMSRRVIQEYEKAGLAETPVTRNKYGYLLYDQSHIERLWQIRFYRELGYEKKQMEEILNDPDYDSHSALKDRILLFKKKRLELENLIAMAEAVDEIGICPTSICSCIPGLQNAPYNLVIPAVSFSLQMLKENLPMLDRTLEPLEDRELQLCTDRMLQVLDGMEEELSPEDPEIQQRVALLQKAAEPRLSSSVLLLSWINLMLAPEAEVSGRFDAFLWPGAAEYLYLAIRRYCAVHEQNPTDALLYDSVAGLLKLHKMGYSPSSPQARSQTDNLRRFFSQIRLFSPEGRMLLLKLFGEFFGSETCCALFSANGEDEAPVYLSEAVKSCCGSLNTQKMEESL